MLTLLLMIAVVVVVSMIVFRDVTYGILIGIVWFTPIAIVTQYVYAATYGLSADARVVLTLAALCAFGAAWTRQAHRQPVVAAVWVNTRERFRFQGRRRGGGNREALVN